MKKMFITAFAAMLIGGSVFAQTPAKGQKPEISIETIAKQKAAQLMLDDATTAKFTPLYQEYLEAMKANRETMKAVNGGGCQKKGGKAQLSDEELDKMITTRFECQQKCLDTQKKYYDKFKKILTVRQAEQLFRFGQPGVPGRMSRNMPKAGKNGSHMRKPCGQKAGQCPQICPQQMEQPE